MASGTALDVVGCCVFSGGNAALVVAICCVAGDATFVVATCCVSGCVELAVVCCCAFGAVLFCFSFFGLSFGLEFLTHPPQKPRPSAFGINDYSSGIF